jgi:hypothetical protein
LPLAAIADYPGTVAVIHRDGTPSFTTGTASLVEVLQAAGCWPELVAASTRVMVNGVAAIVLAILRDRRDFDAETTRDVAATVMRRLAEEGEGAGNSPRRTTRPPPTWHAQGLHAAGNLDDATVAGAVGSERGFAKAALAVLANLRLDDVEKVLAAQSAKGVVALAWHAGLSMRTAIVLQTALAHIAPQTVIRARADGTYPLTPEAMRRQLDFVIGISASRPPR